MAVSTRRSVPALSGGTGDPPMPPRPPEREPRPPIVRPQTNFALSPALATTGIIDYSTRAGEKIYASATKELDSAKYDGEAQGLMAFLELLEERATNFGWDTSIMMIPVPHGNPINILAGYGTISLAQIRAHEESYIGTPSRNAQDANLLYECIMNSVTSECKAKLTIWKREYRCGSLPSGNLLLKVLIRECHLDTNATVGGIRNRLSALDTYLPTVGYNITKFNMYVKNLVDQLRARGEYTNDLLINLFKGYLAATDKSFTMYIDKKLEAYEEGQDMTADQLMLWARNKYDLLLGKGIWNAPTEQEEKIIALQAQVKEMARKLTEKKPQQSSKGTSQKTNTTSKDKKKKSKRVEKPEWFTKKPTNLYKKVTWNNREWNWCGKDTGGKCESFVIHKPTECKGLKRHGSITPSKQNKKVKIKADQVLLNDEKDDNDQPYDDGFLL